METYLGRKVTWEVAFNKRTDDFGNYYDAIGFLHKSGYESGSMCCDLPIAIVKGGYNLPQKWKNFSAKEKKSVDGVLVGEFRNGVVHAYFFDETPINY